MSPVREPTSNGVNTLYFHPSPKLDRMVACESTIETDQAHIFDFLLEYTWYEEQPFPIPYIYKGKLHDYIPDFHAQKGQLNLVFECKPAKFVALEENQAKFQGAREWCPTHGFDGFIVVTDVELRTGPFLESVKFLTQFARYRVAPQFHAQVYGILNPFVEGLPLAELARRLNPQKPQATLISLFCLAYHHHIYIPLHDAPISGDSMVYLPYQVKG